MAGFGLVVLQVCLWHYLKSYSSQRKPFSCAHYAADISFRHCISFTISFLSSLSSPSSTMNGSDLDPRSGSCSASSGAEGQVPSSSCSPARDHAVNGETTLNSTPVHQPFDGETQNRIGEFVFYVLNSKVCWSFLWKEFLKMSFCSHLCSLNKSLLCSSLKWQKE